jgi:2',3'-cyclic-nucleotide 2'-phosphodiesterase (5'-nucleotidase family)
LARRVALVEKMRLQNNRVLVLDSGDLFFSSEANLNPEGALNKALLISRAYRRMGAAAINVGDLDLLLGLDFLQKEFSKGLPLISANLIDASSKRPIFPPYVIREIAGVRIAFLGLLSPDLTPQVAPAIKNATQGKVLIEDPVKIMQETLPGLQKRADILVLLSDLGLLRDRMLARSVRGIHFILGGHDGRALHVARQVGQTFIFQSSSKGMYLGKLQITLENPTSPFTDGGRAYQIQEQINYLDRGLQTLQEMKEDSALPDTRNRDQIIQDIKKRKERLLESLKEAQQNQNQGNRFIFSLEPIEMALPQDGEVLNWLTEAGIDRD